MNDDIIFPKDEAGIDEVPSANSSPLVSHAPTEKSHEDYYAADSRQNQQHQHQQHHPLRNDAAIPDLTAITPTPNRHAPPTSSSDPEKQPTSANASPSAAAAPGADEVNDALPPDGGYGWVCVACCFWINAHTWGLNSSYAVFLAHYLATNAFPGASRLDYAFVGGLSIAVALLVSPLATTVIRLWGTRTCLMVGVVFEAVSFVAASFVGRAWELFLSQGACFGVGMGFLFVGSVGIAPQWFLKRRSLANGIAASGSGLGGLMYSLATNAMIQRIGLPWAFRVLGIIAFVVNFLCVIIIRDRNKQVGSQHLAFDYTLFKRREFLLLQMFGILSMLGYVVLLFSLPNYANSIGMTAKQGSVVGAVLNLGQAFGRPPIGYFSDSMGRINMAATMTFLAALFCLVIWTFATSFGVLVFYAFIGGTVAGTYWAVIAPVAAEVVGLKHIPSCLSITWIMLVPPTLFSEPIALGIVDSNGGKYRAAQLYAGFMYLGAAGAAVLLRAWKIGELEKIALALDQPTESVDPRMAAVVEARADDGGELRRRMSREKARSSFVKRLWMRRKV